KGLVNAAGAPDTTSLALNGSRNIAPYGWTPSATPGLAYKFKVCANDPVSVAENNLTQNCSTAVGPFTWVIRPVASVDLVVDATSVAGDDSQPDTLSNQTYGSIHTLRWGSQNLVPNTCTLTRTVPTPGTAILSNTVTSNATGVATENMVSETYTYTITCDTVSGAVNTAGALVTSVSDTVTVKTVAPTVSCAPSTTSALVKDIVTWTATPSPNPIPAGAGSYSYLWSDLTATYAIQSGDSLTTNPLRVTYSDVASPKNASVTMTAPGGRAIPKATCTSGVTVTTLPASVTLSIDTLPPTYGRTHTLTWTSSNVVGPCTTIGVDPFTVTGGATSGNVSTGALINTSYTYKMRCTAAPNAANAAGVIGGPVDSNSVTMPILAPTFSCAGAPTPVFVNDQVTWTVTPTSPTPTTPPTGSYSYLWNNLTSTYSLVTNYTLASNPLKVTYSDGGPKSAIVTVTAPASPTNRSVTVACGNAVSVNARPDLTANVPTILGLTPTGRTISGITEYFLGNATLQGSINNPNPPSQTSASGAFFSTYERRFPGITDWTAIGDTKHLSDQNAVVARGALSRAVADSDSFAVTRTPSGSYVEFQLCADKPASVTEIDETNNCSATTLKAVIVNRPDLVVSQNPAPVQTGALTQGDILSFNGKVQNSSGFEVGATTLFKNQFKVYRSGGAIDTIPHVSGSDITGLTVSPAAGSEKLVTSGSWTAQAGKHTLTLCADEPSNNITESDELNNCASSEIQVLPKKPTVTPVALTAPVDCGKISLYYSSGTGATSFELYRKAGSDTAPYDFVERASSLSGEQGLRSTDFGDSGVTYFYLVKAFGPDNLSSESTHQSTTVPICQTTGTKPDLIATKIITNGALTVGTKLTFTGTVKNIGTVDVKKNVDFANTFTILQKSPSLFKEVRQKELARGVEVKLTAKEDWVAEAGTFTIKFCTNTDNAVDEVANDRFNCTDSDFTVTGGTQTTDISVTLSADKSGTVAPLEDVALTAVVGGSATGPITYAFDYTSDGVDDVTKPTITPASYTTTGDERYTYSLAGNYTAHVRVTRGGKSAEATTQVFARPRLTVIGGPACQSVTASWETVLGVTQYILSRSSDGSSGSFSPIKTLTAADTSYVDTAVQAGTDYYYRLAATLTDGSSLSSDQFKAHSSNTCSGGGSRLDVTVYGSGVVMTTEREINCRSGGRGQCFATYPSNTPTFRLNFTKPAGITFDRWGGDCSGTGNCDVNMSANRSVTATFGGARPLPTVSCVRTPVGASVEVGQAVTWTGRGSGGTGPYTQYKWTADSEIAGRLGGSIDKTYTTPGTKNATVEVTDSAGAVSLGVSCPSIMVNAVSGFNYTLEAVDLSLKQNETRKTTASRVPQNPPSSPVTLSISRITYEPTLVFVTGNSTVLPFGSGESSFTATVATAISANPPASSDISIQTRSTTPVGVYWVEISGNVAGGSPFRTKTFYVTVTPPLGGGPSGSETSPNPTFEEF
ncbi:MAG: CARDB domain-containing protein, partial [bacterium]|nr:CARDB domain-containing protein [bacterium]